MNDIQANLKRNSSALTPKDFSSGLDVRWCPGCGDYSILKQMQTVLARAGVRREEIVFISGIGCSSRFPYYMGTYGLHGIHGRATTIASGLKATRPELSVWVITGDGDGLSIGGNHMIHLLRRNFNINVLLFNNEIYGLTKGQYSPTTGLNTITKSTPLGSLDHPINPLRFALGSEGTFIARSMDRDPGHLQTLIQRANDHYGTSFLEIYQNCNIFNDGAFRSFTDKSLKKRNALFLEHGQPLVFGAENEFGIRLNGVKPELVKIGEGFGLEDLWIHDESDPVKAGILTGFFDNLTEGVEFPRPFGVFYEEDRAVYEDLLENQIQEAIDRSTDMDLDNAIAGQ